VSSTRADGCAESERIERASCVNEWRACARVGENGCVRRRVRKHGHSSFTPINLAGYVARECRDSMASGCFDLRHVSGALPRAIRCVSHACAPTHVPCHAISQTPLSATARLEHACTDGHALCCMHREDPQQQTHNPHSRARFHIPQKCVCHEYAVLCCAVLCCAVLCCAVLCCAVLCCAVLCCAVLCCDVM
jgi:hypothetical protein